ncbi:GNAT family N-acetyltransferase [Staphylococcus gallinarum]|uniref:GNAT family N-acetyltransferase n=1 Tax=Staphylococcus gallinarum TaxID=1293 RepID=A0A3A0W5B9_STAGA|nr:GNAT family N-acetyltransferase [Staphylococcus gallinarum]RIP37017.1 GNAT family N-acetyltransferase [Staphylococcus gallinarum]
MSFIRRATTEDLEDIVELMYAAYQPIRDLGIHFESAHPTIEKVNNNIKQNICYVYEVDDKLIGTISLRMPWSYNPGPYYYPHIWWLATSPDYKGQGISKALLEYVEEQVIKQRLHASAVTLGTADNHPWLIEMYERRGYRKFGSTDLGKGHITQYLIKVLDESLFVGTEALKQQFTTITYKEDE